MDIGGYEIVRELGRGGQAVVYLANDPRLGRLVALKVLTGLGGIEDSALARFRREAEVTSRLNHPGICAVYEAGVHEGTPFIAMRHVDGQPLSRVVAERDAASTSSDSMHFEFTETGGDAGGDDDALQATETAATTSMSRDETRSLARLIEKTARALHVAHEAGIVHRDIKPGNIIRSNDGDPVILDFGLAAVEEGADGPGLTRTGDLMGTPAYMSPEQIRADHGRIDRRTDVYSLGVTLFECVTGLRPFAAPTRERLYRAILESPAPDARRHNRAIHRDLAVIIATAMEKQPDRRYQSALDLADELARHLRDEPILAKPPGAVVRILRWVQRHKAQTAALVLAFFTVAAVTHTVAAVGREKVAEEKADLEEKLRRQVQIERDSVERQRRELAMRDADARFSEESERLASQYGFMQFGIQGKMDYGPLLETWFGVFRDYGLPLDDAETIEAASDLIRGVFARDPDQGRTVMRALYAILDILDTMEISRAAELAGTGPPRWARERDVDRWEEVAESRPALVVRWSSLRRLARDAEVEERFRVLREVVFEWKRDHDKQRVLDYVEGIDREGSSIDYLVDLTDLLYIIPELRPKAVEILDDGIERYPGSFSLRIARGGVDLQAARTGEGDLDNAILQLEVACALNPSSGVPFTMLASAQLMAGRTREGMATMRRATEVEPDNAGVWLMAARFFAFDEATRDRAIEACKRALAIDPTLEAAGDLLRRIGG